MFRVIKIMLFRVIIMFRVIIIIIIVIPSCVNPLKILCYSLCGKISLMFKRLDTYI